MSTAAKVGDAVMRAYFPHTERFNCRLGEVTLMRFERRLTVCNLGPAVIRGDAQADSAAEMEQALAAAPQVREGVLLRSAPVSAARIRLRGGRIRYIPRRYKRFFVSLTGRTFADYLAGFSSKSRSTLKRKLKRFAQRSGGRVDFRTYRSPAEMEDFYRHARDISRHTYQEVMFDMGLPDDAAFREEMRAAAGQDRVRAFLVFVDDRPAAYLYCPCADGVVEYRFLGYLQEFRQLSPGTVLLLLALESLFEDPQARVFDFTEGSKEGGHKEYFADGWRQCADVYFLRPSLPNALLVLCHTACDYASGYAGRLLDRLRLKRRIKAALRLAKGGVA